MVVNLTVSATYEDGVLKPDQPLPLPERAKVRVTVLGPADGTAVAAEEAERQVRQSQGLLGWVGDIATLRRVAEAPEFGDLESR